MRFSFQTVDTFGINDYFQITFPTGALFNFNSASLIGSISLSQANSSFSGSTLTLRINSLLPTKVYNAPFTMFVLVGQYTAPPSTLTTDAYTVTILRNGYPLQQGTQTVTALQSTLTAAVVDRGSTVVNRNT
jgi:hypothetical protein